VGGNKGQDQRARIAQGPNDLCVIVICIGLALERAGHDFGNSLFVALDFLSDFTIHPASSRPYAASARQEFTIHFPGVTLTVDFCIPML
jgi:hypothetical protein